MVLANNPTSSAAKKQRDYLGALIGRDLRHTKMTVHQASDFIERVELKELEKQSQNVNNLDYNGKPFTEAHVTYVTGEQGGGKSTTATAIVVDAYDKKCVEIFCEKILKIGVIVKNYDRRTRLAEIIYDGERRIIKIPDSYDLQSPMRVKDYEKCPMRIFSNVHLYGVIYGYIPSFRHLARWLRKNIIHDCWLIIDESYVGASARGCMGLLGKELATQSQQFRKGQMDVIIITTMSKLNDWVIRLLPTEQREVRYDKKLNRVFMEIRKKGVKGVKKIDYDPTYYRQFFWTRERVLN